MLAASVAERLGLPLGGRRLRRFADGEVHFQIEESIRGKDIYIVQSTSPPVDEHYMELFVMLDAFRRASPGNQLLEVPGAGHFVHADDSLSYASAVADFLRSRAGDCRVCATHCKPQKDGLISTSKENRYAVT